MAQLAGPPEFETLPEDPNRMRISYHTGNFSITLKIFPGEHWTARWTYVAASGLSTAGGGVVDSAGFALCLIWSEYEVLLIRSRFISLLLAEMASRKSLTGPCRIQFDYFHG
jgi:hypothetical protein